MRKLYCAVWAALTVLSPGFTSAAVPGDPWSIGAKADEMSGASETTAETVVTAGSHRFELTAKCLNTAGLSAISLDVLVPHDRFQLVENTTVHGSELFGYKADTQTRTVVRLKFDEGDVITAQAQAPYTNDFTLLFPDMNQSKRAFGPGASAPGTEGLAKGLLGFAMMFGGAADVGNLIANGELRIQPTLANGETPVIRVPLTLPFKRFVAACFNPAASTGQNPNDLVSRVTGTFRASTGNLDMVIRNGQITMMMGGRVIKGPQDLLGPNSSGIQGDTIILDKNEPATLRVLDANTLVFHASGIDLTFRRVN